MAKIPEELTKAIEQNKGKSISIGTILILLPVLAVIDTRYVSIAELEAAEYKIHQRIDATQIQIQENRKQYLKDEIFILDYERDKPETDPNLNRALRQRYQQEINSIK